MTNSSNKSPASLGDYLAEVTDTLADLDRRDVIARIWRKDHTVWQPDPAEITNRLGWLDITQPMSQQVPTLQSFAQEIREAGFRHVVLLGMGGSSLGPEVLRQTFGSTPGYPELMVLDSTVPSQVAAVTKAIDTARTLLLVSSKSGTTTEPISLYHYFRNLVESAVGEKKAGQNFMAITDPGTPLAELAGEAGFRRVFLNAADIGGRYSVLSYFGLVPAALMGIDLKTLIRRAASIRKECAASVPASNNPAAWLGTIMGTLALKGRDKLTLILSPAIRSFGLWVEQLIAESTGKKGKGIMPIADEPPVSAAHYGNDRLFVYLRLENDDNAAIDASWERIKSSGQPAVTIDMRDRYDLGAEFFRWELATAVAGSILGINPFDQPDVQAAKDATAKLLQQYITSTHLPEVEASDSLNSLLTEAEKGNYFAIMAYLRQTPAVDRALAELRRQITARYGVATTLGYGPRYLHSTGQLHKGGPNKGLFLQITARHDRDIPIPGKVYTFGVVVDAQARGDLQALQRRGRRTARIHLDRESAAAVSRIVNEVA